MAVPTTSPAPAGSIALEGFLAISFNSQWRNYRKESRRCLKSFSDESVHDVRIAIRRLLASLGLLRSLLPPQHIDHAHRALKKRLKTFSRLRDTHAQLLYVRSLRKAFPAARGYHSALARREQRLIKRVRRRLPRAKDERLAESISALKELLRELPENHAHESVRFTAVTTALRTAFIEVTKRHRAIQKKDTSTIHRTRIAFKQFRYMAEALQPILPGVSRRMEGVMRNYQARMGDIHDIELLMDGVEKFAAKHDGKPEPWASFHAELLRRRAVLVRRFFASPDRFKYFASILPSRARSRRAIHKCKP